MNGEEAAAYTVPMEGLEATHTESNEAPAADHAGTTAPEAHEEHGTGIHVALSAEQVGTFAGMPITNTLVTSWVVIALLAIFAVIVGRRLSLVPGRLQTAVESAVTFIYDFVENTLEDKKLARRFFPFLMTLFLFIAVSNVLEFVPGVGSIGFWHGNEFTSLFRSVNTDLNVTLALAIIAVIVVEVAGVAALGFWHYASKFINFSSPVKFVVGLIELVSEVARLVSFSFRLFGNIFAGEVLLAVIAFFVPYVLPSGFMLFELFVGIIQGAVFMLLTLFFIKLAVSEPH